MSTPRLFFLYPALLRPSIRQTSARNAAFLSTRHGTAVDPDQGKKKSDKSDKPDENAPPEGALTANPTPTTPTDPTLEESPSLELVRAEDSNGNIEEDGTGTKHHFDTFNGQKILENSSFTPEQSSIIISALRSKLKVELANASSQLVSRSRAENESYLFHAACSELRSEIESLRRRHTEEMRVQRASAKVEFDGLNTAFVQEISEYKNALRGMFDERKMEVRAEQRAMENKIQELNYKITVLIQSELKSDVEGLRWITTRRGLLAIGTLAVFIVFGIKLNTKPKEEKKKKTTESSPEGPVPFAGPVGLG